MMPYFTTEGDVRGGCGHKHRSFETADACRKRDHRDCQRGNGRASYSDRRVVWVAADGNPGDDRDIQQG